MTQLKQGIANKAQIKGSENYHDADTDKQTAYDNAVTKAEELLKQNNKSNNGSKYNSTSIN